jgi:hypothetical protein
MPIVDNFDTHTTGLSGPYSNAAQVTPSDSADLGYVTRALWCGATGNLKVTLVNGDTVTFDHGAHQLIAIRAKRVWATGTVSTPNIVALW